MSSKASPNVKLNGLIAFPGAPLLACQGVIGTSLSGYPMTTAIIRESIRSSIPLFLALAIATTHCQQTCAQVAKLYPVDEASKDPSFLGFKARLLTAIQRRDSAFILSILSPKITSSFGGDGGIAEFTEWWKLDRPGSELWKTLGTVMALGGSFDGKDTFSAPYTFSKFSDEFDAFEYGVVMGKDVSETVPKPRRSRNRGTLVRHHTSHRLGTEKEGQPGGKLDSHRA